MLKTTSIWLALVVLLFAWGCAATSTRTNDLLDLDYAVMSDAELENYYLDLNDQIARVERQGRDTRIGIGVGSAPVHVGVSTGVTRGTVAEELRDRRNAVRAELSRRGLRP